VATAKTKQKTNAKTTKKTAVKPRQTKTRQITPSPKNLEKPRKKEIALDIVPEAGIEFLDVKLTPLRRAFLVYYITPGQPCFQNALQSALKAGYAPSTAKVDIYVLLRDPEIQKIIRINENLIYQKLHSAAMKAIEVKQLRAFYDPEDYYEEKEITVETKNGSTYVKKVNALKNLEDMTLEQRLCIDGMDIKGNASIPVYIMADRGKELNDLIKIDNDLAKAADNSDGEEETMEIIMERLTVKKTVRQNKDEISKIAGLARFPKKEGITEL
jgi:phage terminase small subunit